MPQPYRIEFYKRNYTLDCWGLCSAPTYRFDYLTLEEWQAEIIGKINPARGDYVNIVKGNKTLYQGVLTSCDTASTEGMTLVTIRPLQALFDFEMYVPFITIPGTAEGFIKNAIEWGRKNNPDPSANLPGLSIYTTSDTELDLVFDNNVSNLWDTINNILKQTRVVVDVGLYPAQKQLLVKIGKNTDTCNIEADLPNVLQKTLNIQNSSGNPNSCLVVNKDWPEQYAWYFNTTPFNGIWKVKEITLSTGETFAERAIAEKNAVIVSSQFDNCIEITTAVDDKLVTAEKIGTLADIITEGRAIPSVLTGIEKDENVKTLIFGAVRLDLTRQLIMQRRTKK